MARKERDYEEYVRNEPSFNRIKSKNSPKNKNRYKRKSIDIVKKFKDVTLLKEKIIKYFNSNKIDNAFQQFSYLEENQQDTKKLLLKSASNIANDIEDTNIKSKFLEFLYQKGLYDIVILTSYGDALAKNGEYEKAYELFEKSLSLNDSNTIALTSYGDALAKNGEYEKAYELFEKSLVLSETSFSKYINYLLYSQALEMGGEIEKAIEKLELIREDDIPYRAETFVFYILENSIFL